MKTPLLLAAAALALAACVGKDDARPPVRTPPVLAGVPIPSVAEVVDTSGTADAARAVLSIAWPPDSVVAFYRRELPRHGFRIVGDLSDSVRIDLYAQRDGPSLWVQVRRGDGQGSTRYTLIGALAGTRERGDSAPGAARR